MQDADNFDALGLLPRTIDDDKGRSGDHELAGAETGGSRHSIILFSRHHGPDDTDHFVGQGDGRDHARFAPENTSEPIVRQHAFLLTSLACRSIDLCLVRLRPVTNTVLTFCP